MTAPAAPPAAPAATADQQPDTQAQAAPDATGGDAEKDPRVVASLQAIRTERDTAIQERKAALRELDQVRRGSLTAAEQALADAKSAGETEANGRWGQRLARSAFDAEAARRDAEFDTNSVLEYVDLKKFIKDDGEPDLKAIKQAVERLVPAKAAGAQAPPSFEGGARTTSAAPVSMTSMIRKAAGRE